MAEEIDDLAKSLSMREEPARERGMLLREQAEAAAAEETERGSFDFLRKKEKEDEQVLATEVDKLQLEEKEEEKKELRRSDSSSSSSSEEEEVGDGEKKEKKKKKKKGLKEKLHHKEGGEEEKVTVVSEHAETVVVEPAPAPHHEEGTSITIGKMDETTMKVEVAPEEGKKGFLDKIKKLVPGHNKKEEAHAPAPAAEVAVTKENEAVEEGKEKKGMLGKFMEKIPGYHKETEKTTPPAQQ